MHGILIFNPLKTDFVLFLIKGANQQIYSLGKWNVYLVE
jgi:hypothetical protein